MEGFTGTRLAVFAPTPILTVTIEAGNRHGPETHFHAGGQGIWVARMAAALGARVVLCVTLAGESGDVLDSLLGREGVEVRSVRAHGRSASYIHDRRSGERVSVAETFGPRLWRHETDELYGVMLAAGLEADLSLLTGTQPHDVVGADVYRRLAGDLRANDRRVIADLSDEALDGALAGGVELLKVSHEDLIKRGLAAGPEPAQLLAGARTLRAAGADAVVVSRAEEPALALVEGGEFELVGPRFAAQDPTGAGDSMFAAIGVALAGGQEALKAMKYGVAAGALNATRRGRGTGQPADIERITARVHVHPVVERSSLAAGGGDRVAGDLDE
jgi:1-phosphofructokinase